MSNSVTRLWCVKADDAYEWIRDMWSGDSEALNLIGSWCLSELHRTGRKWSCILAAHGYSNDGYFYHDLPDSAYIFFTDLHSSEEAAELVYSSGDLSYAVLDHTVSAYYGYLRGDCDVHCHEDNPRFVLDLANDWRLEPVDYAKWKEGEHDDQTPDSMVRDAG